MHELRPEYPAIKIGWDKNAKDFDLRPGYSFEAFSARRFYGPAPASIGFLRCVGWGLKDSPCHKTKVRQALGKGIYEYYQKISIAPPRGFLLPALFSVENATKLAGDNGDLRAFAGKELRRRNHMAPPSIRRPTMRLND